MRNAILGAIAGSAVTLVCVCIIGYFTPVLPPSPSGGDTAGQGSEAGSGLSSGTAAREGSRKDTDAAAALDTASARKDDAPSPSSERDATEWLLRELLAAAGNEDGAGEEGGAGVYDAIDSLAEFYAGRDRRTGRELRDRVEELKKRGREVVPDLIGILKGEGPEASKVIAAGVLGAINAELQDPEVAALLDGEIVPMLKGIVGGEGDRRLRWQAVSALGDIATVSSHKVLAEMVTGEGDRRMQMAASYTLARTGTVDTAYALLPSLTNAASDSEMLTMAGCIAEINKRVSDAGIAEQLTAVVPALEEMAESAAGDRRRSWLTLNTLAAIGSSDANEYLVELASGGEDVDEGLRRSASWVIGRSGSPDLAVQLGDVLGTETDPDRRIDIASTIGRIAVRNPDTAAATVSESRALPALKMLAVSGETQSIRTRAVETVGQIGSAADIPALQEIAQADESLQSAVDGAVRRIERRAEGGGTGSRRFRGFR